MLPPLIWLFLYSWEPHHPDRTENVYSWWPALRNGNISNTSVCIWSGYRKCLYRKGDKEPEYVQKRFPLEIRADTLLKERRRRHDRDPYRRDRNSRPTQHGVSSSLSGATSVSEAGDPPTIEPNSRCRLTPSYPKTNLLIYHYFQLYSQSTFQKTGVANIHGGLFMNIQNNCES